MCQVHVFQAICEKVESFFTSYHNSRLEHISEVMDLDLGSEISHINLCFVVLLSPPMLCSKLCLWLYILLDS